MRGRSVPSLSHRTSCDGDKQLLYVLLRIQRVFCSLVFSCYPPTVVVATLDGVHTLSEICMDVLFQVYYPITVSPILGIHIMLCVLHTVWRVFLTLVSTWYPLLIPL